MGFYFRKRVGLGPLALNLSKSGLGLSLGVRGFHAGISSTGRRYVSASLPGTGLYLRHYAHSGNAPTHTIAPSSSPLVIPHPVTGQPQPHGIAFALGYVSGWVVLVLLPLLALSWVVHSLLR